jgi:hypothetical protein
MQLIFVKLNKFRLQVTSSTSVDLTTTTFRFIVLTCFHYSHVISSLNRIVLSEMCSPAHAMFHTTIHDRWDHSKLSSPVSTAACDTIATGLLPLYRIACSPQIPDRNCKTLTPPPPTRPSSLFLAALMR